MKYIMPVIALFVFVCNADAAVKVKNITSEKFIANAKSDTETEQGLEIDPDIDEEAAIATLEQDIRIIDEKLNTCKKQKKGWVAATVIGGAGVLSTGIVAAVQAGQIKTKKNELDDKQKELKELNTKKDNIK